MKRNRFGVNLDEGVPLQTKEDFERLYVDCFNSTIETILSWLQEGEGPLLFGGQIGSGKSTVIKKILAESSLHPDITVHFDRESMNLDASDFWAITLSEFIRASLINQIDLSFCELPRELGGFPPARWDLLLELLFPQKFSLEAFRAKGQIRKNIAQICIDAPDYITKVVEEIASRLQNKVSRQLFVFVSGIDKFDLDSAAFFSMQEILATLLKYKTLFEVNTVHLFGKASVFFSSGKKVFLPSAGLDSVAEMLIKRMGIYAEPILRELRILAYWSGGNPRQALRLLKHFETARKKGKDGINCIADAIFETISDFFALSPQPSTDLIKTIQRDRKIESSFISGMVDSSNLRLALYGNWIILKGLGDGISYPAEINPLVKAFFIQDYSPEEPETKLLKEYAQLKDINPLGLNIRSLDDKTGNEKSSDQILQEYFASGIEQTIQLNLDEVFDALQGALLSKERADRAIIAFKDESVVEAARAYLFAKANTYEYQRFIHMEINGEDNNFLAKFEEVLALDTDIISLDLTGEWKEAQLKVLDKQRDRFLDYQMIWWIPFNKLKEYLFHWIQLRQIFEIYVLEDELLGSISIEEIEADIAFFQDLVENEDGSEANVVTNLKIVLNYLKKVREGGSHE